MSLFSKIISGIGRAATGFAAGGPVGALIGGASSFLPTPRAPSAALPAPSFVGGTVPSFTQVRGMPVPRIPQFPGRPPAAPGVPIPFPSFGDAAGGACPAGFHLDKRTRSKCVRNRRMNPLNGKAANRAIRRIKGARKMLQKIERQLPKAKARRTPAHGHRTTVQAI